MERSSGRNYSQAAIAVLVITTSSALTEMWTILTHPFLFMYPQILKIIWKSFTPTAFSRNHRTNHRRNCTRLSWEMLKPPNSTGIQENLKDSPATTSTPWMSTTATEELWFEQQLSPGDVLERGDSNSEKITYIGMHRRQQFKVNVST